MASGSLHNMPTAVILGGLLQKAAEFEAHPWTQTGKTDSSRVEWIEWRGNRVLWEDRAGKEVLKLERGGITGSFAANILSPFLGPFGLAPPT